jgi:lipopolysaccharide heptosyltransferase I
VSPPSVLIVRLGALGDIVHAMPVVAALRDAWPDARIGWLVREAYAGLVALVDGVACIHVVRETPDMAAVREMRAAGYDICLDLQGLLKSAVYARASGAHRVIGFSKGLAREATATLAYTETGGVPGGHVIDRNVSLLARLGITPTTRPGIRLTVPSSDVVSSAQVLLGGADVPFALCNPGAGWPNKRWPADRFGRLADRLLAEHGLRTLVVWGPGEASLAAEVVRASEVGAAVMAPESAIPDILALARVARVVVAGDTGPLHLGAAVGAPLVGLYGPTPPERNGPWSPQDRWVSRHDACRCIFKRRCTSDTWCLGQITVDEVAAAVTARLGVPGLETGPGACDVVEGSDGEGTPRLGETRPT